MTLERLKVEIAGLAAVDSLPVTLGTVNYNMFPTYEKADFEPPVPNTQTPEGIAIKNSFNEDSIFNQASTKGVYSFQEKKRYDKAELLRVSTELLAASIPTSGLERYDKKALAKEAVLYAKALIDEVMG